MAISELVTQQHLSRKAVVYIRQSTLNQVFNNQESLELQYALKQRAIDLGWIPENIEIIDNDLGLTASSASHREGFKELVTQVTLQKVGIILSYDVTRLSRNCSDWYPLLDVCGYRGCLIADRDSIYDPSSSNGRLLLGLKGQLAEVELTTIRSRLIAGLENKAKRGELAVSLPAGLSRDLQGKVIKNPNIEVVHSIELVFDTFSSRKSALQVVKYFHEHQLKIPIYDNHKDLIWCEATPSRILRVLQNPAYSGAFVYGRRKTIRNGMSTVDIKRRFVPPEQWRIIVKDKYPSYISWPTFEKNQEIIQNNYAEYNKRISSGMPRKGELLLQGIAYCECCGHKYFVVYKNYNKYICHQKNSQHYGAAICQKISAEQIDDAVVKAFFKALSPIELDAYAQAQQLGKITKEKMKISYMRELERLRYQTKLAERQFNQVDPDNRLVANELEKRWENALREVSEAEKQFQIKIEKLFEPSEQISIEMKEAFMQIGRRLPQVWNTLKAEQKKAFLRCLINKVVMQRIDCVAIFLSQLSASCGALTEKLRDDFF
jgi:DNA invertase Pin-like site-specific DNA recombinase